MALPSNLEVEGDLIFENEDGHPRKGWYGRHKAGPGGTVGYRTERPRQLAVLPDCL